MCRGRDAEFRKIKGMVEQTFRDRPRDKESVGLHTAGQRRWRICPIHLPYGDVNIGAVSFRDARYGLRGQRVGEVSRLQGTSGPEVW